MKLSDFSTNPTAIRKNLQIQGPLGAKTVSRTLSIATRVVSPTSDTVFTEEIKMVDGAVVTGSATVSEAPNDIQRVTVAEGKANCYWLPWAEGYVYWGTLGGDHDYFFTYTINGCGVIIGGNADAPVVAHANLASDRLGQAITDAMKQHKPEAVGSVVAKEQALIYDQFYGNLAAQLIDRGNLTGARVEVVTPYRYLIDAGAGFGAVFGVRRSTGWVFYGNWAKTTTQIWP